MERVSHEAPRVSHTLQPSLSFLPLQSADIALDHFPQITVLMVHPAALPGEHSTKPAAGEMEIRSQPLPRELLCRGEALLEPSSSVQRVGEALTGLQTGLAQAWTVKTQQGTLNGCDLDKGGDPHPEDIKQGVIEETCSCSSLQALSLALFPASQQSISD